MKYGTILRVGMVCAALFALGAAGPDNPKPESQITLEVLNLKVQKALPKDLKENMFADPAGISVQLLLTDAATTIVDIDENTSSVQTFTDDKGTDLKKYEGRFYWHEPFTGTPKIMKDGHAAAVEIASTAMAAKDASKIIVKGSLSVLVASSQASVDAKDVPLKEKSKFTAGPFAMTLSAVKDNNLDQKEMKVGLTLAFTGDGRTIQSIAFLDDQGKEIKSARTGSMQSNNDWSLDYELATKPVNVTVRVTYYDKIETIKVPIDVQTGLGL